jgi:hypothetical protein
MKNQLYWCDYKNYRDFSLSADNFIFETAIRNDSITGGIDCNDIVIELIAENGSHMLYLAKPICRDFIQLQFGEITLNSSNYNVTQFLVDTIGFHHIEMKNMNNHINVFLNDSLILDTNYLSVLGKLYGIEISFRGSGAIDMLRLGNLNREDVFLEDF